ncbi:MAG: hypothetical protein ACYTGG_12725 [Planctomycetota bacterium]|jgi:hypothetical protein
MRTLHRGVLPACLLATLSPAPRVAGDVFAAEVVSYAAGTNPTVGYTDPAVALGPPERFSGEGVFPGVVSVFNPAWRPDEIVSIGAGGHLVLHFTEPVTDDPDNLYGIDLIIFGNAGLADDAFPDGICGSPCVLFSDGGSIAVSADGQDWIDVPGLEADGLFPTQGYLDVADPYAAAPGIVESDFTRPVDPRLGLDDLDGLAYDDILALYRGSGGGVGVDLAGTGLGTVSYVRITAAADAFDAPEIDAVADVPPRLPGDIDLDGLVTVTDLLLLLSSWGPDEPGDPPADFDADGQVAIQDLLTLLANWTN